MSKEENFHRTMVFDGDYRFHTDCLINIIYPKLKYNPSTKLGSYTDRFNKRVKVSFYDIITELGAYGIIIKQKHLKIVLARGIYSHKPVKNVENT